MQEAFFVRSPSPGAVLRFLERLARRGEALPDVVWISDAMGEPPWRALSGVGLERVAPRLAQAFPPEVLWVVQTRVGWQWCRFADDGTQESGTLGKKRLWQPSSPLELWGKPRGLPLARLTHPPRILDYDTVAQLDQRSLLQEDTPRRYQFSLTDSENGR
ncbi:hypothetical protein [Armatimonas sp.]|uniref:hypothetical protein n=1 Tax=Armatimonas sp. TaxID=1872638 RepID=UPI00286B7895|nr:hypothetical protein [Armatimonas sp.]